MFSNPRSNARRYDGFCSARRRQSREIGRGELSSTATKVRRNSSGLLAECWMSLDEDSGGMKRNFFFFFFSLRLSG